MKKLLLIILPLVISSCILVPVMDSIKKAGLTPADRRALLGKNVKNFHEAMHWNNLNDAMLFVYPESNDKISDYFQKNMDEEKIVETKVKSVKFDDGAYSATVEVTTRAYKIPYYIVTDRVEREVWKWSLTNDWRISDIERIVKK